MTDKKYPCEKCDIRKYHARVFDVHFDHIDCPCECPYEKEKECEGNDR